jgi:hypothetical protein
MPVHRSKDGVDLGIGPHRDIVGMVRIPHVRVSRIGHDVATWRHDPRVTEPALPPISLGDRASSVSGHDKVAPKSVHEIF